jgi:hypothetical protein
MAGGASSPRRTDAGEHSDPFELVDRAREGELDESTRRRLTMVLRSHRDAALELAWMELFDDVRTHVDEEPTQVRPPDPVVERLMRALDPRRARPEGPMDAGPTDVTRRVCRIELVDEDARTQKLRAVDVPDLPEIPVSEAPVSEIPVPRVALEWDEVTGRDEWHDTTLSREDARWSEDVPPPRIVVVPERVAKLRASKRGSAPTIEAPNPGVAGVARAPREGSARSARAPRAPTVREATTPWVVERTPRRDDTPIATTLHTRSAGRSWAALVLTAVLSIAAGWVAHGLWRASSDAPPVLASSPIETSSPETSSPETSSPETSSPETSSPETSE